MMTLIPRKIRNIWKILNLGQTFQLTIMMRILMLQIKKQTLKVFEPRPNISAYNDNDYKGGKQEMNYDFEPKPPSIMTKCINFFYQLIVNFVNENIRTHGFSSFFFFFHYQINLIISCINVTKRKCVLYERIQWIIWCDALLSK